MTKIGNFINEDKEKLVSILPYQVVVNSETRKTLAEDLSSLSDKATKAESIAKGKATGYVFDTKADMDAWLENADNVSKLLLGDNLYIRATDTPDYWWDGTSAQELETQKVDFSNIVKDVQVGGVSAVKDGVVNIPTSSKRDSEYDHILVRVANGWGFALNSGFLVSSETEAKISNRMNGNDRNPPLTNQHIDYAVKCAMCDGKGAAWTDTEKAAARARMGVTEKQTEVIAEITLDSDASSVQINLDKAYRSMYISFTGRSNDADNTLTGGLVSGGIEVNGSYVFYGSIAVNHQSNNTSTINMALNCIDGFIVTTTYDARNYNNAFLGGARGQVADDIKGKVIIRNATNLFKVGSKITVKGTPK